MDERYCIDNGAMIAQTGLLDYLEQEKGRRKIKKKGEDDNIEFDREEYMRNLIRTSKVRQRFRTDEQEIYWRKDDGEIYDEINNENRGQ
jgi:hypothetical protein